MTKEVVLCEHAGVCFGAGRALECLDGAIDGKSKIYTYGPILHNAKLVEQYEKKGVTVIEDINGLKNISSGKVVIRAHGVSKAVYDALEKSGLEIIDATCPFVKRIHKIVKEESEKGSSIVVIGDPTHPEVEGIIGWSVTPSYVIETKEEAMNFVVSHDTKICIVSQTTFNRNKFKELVEILQKNSYNISVMNTICDATTVRQAEALEISKKADVMIVIGDRKSSNSKKLFEICNANCDCTYFIQELDDIVGRLPKVSGLVGITAGASTPKYIIEEVQSYVRNDF